MNPGRFTTAVKPLLPDGLDTAMLHGNNACASLVGRFEGLLDEGDLFSKVANSERSVQHLRQTLNWLVTRPRDEIVGAGGTKADTT